MNEKQAIELIQEGIGKYWSANHKADRSIIEPIMSIICKELQKLEDLAE